MEVLTFSPTYVHVRIYRSSSIPAVIHPLPPPPPSPLPPLPPPPSSILSSTEARTDGVFGSSVPNGQCRSRTSSHLSCGQCLTVYPITEVKQPILHPSCSSLITPIGIVLHHRRLPSWSVPTYRPREAGKSCCPVE